MAASYGLTYINPGAKPAAPKAAPKPAAPKPKAAPKPRAPVGGKVVVPPSANRAGVPLTPGILHVVRKVAARTGPLTVGTGTNHNRLTVNGLVSDHWDGNATDIPSSGADLIHKGQQALIAAGMSPAQARQQTGGLYNLPYGNHGRRIQIIFNTQEGGDHTNHLHIGVTALGGVSSQRSGTIGAPASAFQGGGTPAVAGTAAPAQKLGPGGIPVGAAGHVQRVAAHLAAHNARVAAHQAGGKAAPAAPATGALGNGATPYDSIVSGLNDQEQRVRDVADRQQSANLAYQKWAADQFDRLGASGRAADSSAANAAAALQAATAGQQQSAQQQFIAAHGGQVGNALNGVNDAAQAGAAINAARQAQVINREPLAAAAAENVRGANVALGAANTARIGGQASQDIAGLEGKRTDLLTHIADQQVADSRTQAQIDAANARTSAQLGQSDRNSQRTAVTSRTNSANSIAAASARQDKQISSSTSLALARIDAQATQGAANRAAALKRTKLNASAGVITPAAAARRRTAVRHLSSSVDSAAAFLTHTKALLAQPDPKTGKPGAPLAPDLARLQLTKKFPQLPPEAVDYLLARAFASRTNKAPLAAAQTAYQKLISDLALGTINSP